MTKKAHCDGPSVEQDLDGLLLLPPNWDGYGAPLISPDIVASAKTWVAALWPSISVSPAAVPLSTGNLQLEWHRGTRILELEVETPTTLHYLKWNSEECVKQEGSCAMNDVDQALSLIRWFQEGTNDA
jgi:hypothetical protein